MTKRERAGLGVIAALSVATVTAVAVTRSCGGNTAEHETEAPRAEALRSAEEYEAKTDTATATPRKKRGKAKKNKREKTRAKPTARDYFLSPGDE